MSARSTGPSGGETHPTRQGFGPVNPVAPDLWVTRLNSPFSLCLSAWSFGRPEVTMRVGPPSHSSNPQESNIMANAAKGKSGVVSKMDAVREALRHLGSDAKPAQIQGFIKEKF